MVKTAGGPTLFPDQMFRLVKFLFVCFSLQGVPDNVKTFLKSDIYYLPVDLTSERADMIDKALASTRLFWPKVKNAMPLIVERLTEVYGADWPGMYQRYAFDLKKVNVFQGKLFFIVFPYFFHKVVGGYFDVDQACVSDRSSS